MLTPEQVRSYIVEKINCQHCEVIGDGTHFLAKIVSEIFDGKRALQRHRLVYQALAGKVGTEIHALSIEAFTPKEWGVACE